MRAVDVLMSFPVLIMGLMVMAILGSGLFKLIIAIAIVLAPRFVRIAHAPTLEMREKDFIEAARALGISTPRLLARHIFPNIFGEVLVMGTLWTGTAIRMEANLSFIGLGVPPPIPTWGNMIRARIAITINPMINTGNDMRTSTARMIRVSIHPPLNPAIRPNIVPITMAMLTEETETARETRAPQIIRERVSRPKSSVPNKCVP